MRGESLSPNANPPRSSPYRPRNAGAHAPAVAPVAAVVFICAWPRPPFANRGRLAICRSDDRGHTARKHTHLRPTAKDTSVGHHTGMAMTRIATHHYVNTGREPVAPQCSRHRRPDHQPAAPHRPPAAKPPTTAAREAALSTPTDCSSTLPHEAGHWNISGRSGGVGRNTGSTRLRVARHEPRQGTNESECFRSAAPWGCSGLSRPCPVGRQHRRSQPTSPLKAMTNTISVSTAPAMVALQMVRL
jgi:hypothetical protein